MCGATENLREKKKNGNRHVEGAKDDINYDCTAQMIFLMAYSIVVTSPFIANSLPSSHP